jgi:hypothetical protein
VAAAVYHGEVTLLLFNDDCCSMHISNAGVVKWIMMMKMVECESVTQNAPDKAGTAEEMDETHE